MKRRNVVYTVSGYGMRQRIVAKTPSAAVCLFRRALLKFPKFKKIALAGRGFDEISVEPRLPLIHNIAALLREPEPRNQEGQVILG